MLGIWDFEKGGAYHERSVIEACQMVFRLAESRLARRDQARRAGVRVDCQQITPGIECTR